MMIFRGCAYDPINTHYIHLPPRIMYALARAPDTVEISLLAMHDIQHGGPTRVA